MNMEGELMKNTMHTAWKRCICFLMIVLVCITMLPAPVSAEKNATITVLSNIDEDAMKPYLDAFKKKYPAINVKYYSYSDYENELQNRIEKGNYGDVLFVPSFLSSDKYDTYLEKLGSYQELSEKYNYLEESKHIDDAVYGIPSSAYMAGILYNKDVFNKAGITETPKSIDAFLADLQTIKERTDAIPFYTNYSSQWTLQFWETFPYLEMTGDPDYKNNKFIYERNPFSKGSTHYQVYQLLYDIVKDGLCEDDPKSDDWEKSKSMLNRGEIGCMAIGSWAVSQFKQAGPDGDAVAFMPFPNEIDGKQYMTISTDYCYAINKNSKEKDAARKYIDFMLDESGHALDQENLSLVKTDPYPDAYGDMKNAILSSNTAATNVNYSRWKSLSQNLNMEDNQETARVIAAAAGYTDESLDDIVKDWNERWESGRPKDMESEMQDASSDRLNNSVVTENYEVTLSQTEQRYLKDVGTIKVGYLTEFAPYQYKDENGKFTGVSQQICDIISSTLNVDMKYIAYGNRKDLIAALEKGEIDMAAGLDSESENDSLRFSKSYQDYMQVLIKNETTNIDKLEDKKQVVVIGQEDEDQNSKNQLKKISLRAAIKAVDAGEADYVIGDYYSADYYIRDLESEHVSVVPMSERGAISFAFSAGQDTRLISVCNKCLYSIPESRIQVLLMDDLDPPAKPVTLMTFVRENPWQSALIVLALLALIGLSVFFVLRQRWISARKHAVDVKRYEILAALMNEYVFEYDSAKKQIHLDSKFKDKFGIDGDVAIEKYEKDNPCLNAILLEIDKVNNADDATGYNSHPFKLRMDDGTMEWYRVIFYALKDEYDVESHIIGKLVSAKQEMAEQEQFINRAQRDPLTGLYNRDGFMEQYATMEVKESLTYAILDIDNFKQVNDKIGHAGGDAALKILADTLSSVFQKQAIVGRYGGDEFMVCVYDMDKYEVVALFDKLVKAMDCDMDYQGKIKHLSISPGAAYAGQKMPLDVLLKSADKVLYLVKEQGKNNWNMDILE